MNALKEKLNGIVLCLFELITGVLLLISPVSFTSGIIVTAGAVMLVIGLIDIIRYFRTAPEDAAIGQTLTKGLAAMIIGAFCAFNSSWFLATFPALTILYGVVTLMTGLGKVQITVDMLRLKKQRWYVAAVSAVISVVSAIVILSSPFASTAVLWIFIGVSLIVEAVIDLITLITGDRNTEETTV